MPGNPSPSRRPCDMPGRIRSKKQVNTSQFQCFWLFWGPGHESRITNHSWLRGGSYLAFTWLAPPNPLPITWLALSLHLAWRPQAFSVLCSMLDVGCSMFDVWGPGHFLGRFGRGEGLGLKVPAGEGIPRLGKPEHSFNDSRDGVLSY